METKTRQVITELLIKPPNQFVADRWGYQNVDTLNRSIQKAVGIFGDTQPYMFTIDGEAKQCNGHRRITFEQFKRKYISLHGNGMSDDTLIKYFESIEENELINENGHKWIYCGTSKHKSPHWKTKHGKVMVWVNMDTDWDINTPPTYLV